MSLRYEVITLCNYDRTVMSINDLSLWRPCDCILINMHDLAVRSYFSHSLMSQRTHAMSSYCYAVVTSLWCLHMNSQRRRFTTSGWYHSDFTFWAHSVRTLWCDFEVTDRIHCDIIQLNHNDITVWGNV